MRPRYRITKQFMRMTGFYDSNGKMCTLVTETRKTFMVDQSPLEILDESIRCIGYDLKGAMITAKRLLGNVHHCPVLVNPIHRIVLFPTKSGLHEECTWFNPVHIKRTNSLNNQTTITFSNGQTITIPGKLSSFNCKIKRAEHLEEMTRDSIFFIINGHDHRMKQRKKKGNHLP
ncbi:competence protein ComK [Bacillus sp. JJ1503]|uniref:competence protein ComK n=1 Tax=Bacillus sp. JJ1503 TaxID=3122956 RepID=UPI002FFEE29A